MQHSRALGGWVRPAPAAVRLAARLARGGAALATLLRAERERMVLFLPVAMGAGVATYDGLRFEPRVAPTAATALLLLALALLARRREALRAAALVALAVAAGLLSAELSTARALPLEKLPKGAVALDGTVRVIDRLDRGVRVTLADIALPDGDTLRRRVRVRLRDSDPAASTIAVGDRIALRALLRAPPAPAWPGAPDPRRTAFHAGLAGSGFALGRLHVLSRPPARPDAAAGLRTLRESIADVIQADLPGVRGAIAATLLVGISNGIPAADRTSFTTAGLAHLLAVAGLHVGIVMGLVMGAVRFGLAAWPRAALNWPTRQIAALAALAAGLAYLLGTGAHLPIIRSFCMAALATLAIVLGRRAISMRGLAVAATVILAAWPEELEGVSFRMSFAAVAALIAGYEVARPWFARLATGAAGRRLALHVAALALTSLLAGAASMPFAAARFGQIQPWFILANLIAVPMTAILVLPAGLVALALMPFGLERLALVPMGWGIGAMLEIARAITRLPDAMLHVRPPGEAAVGAVALGLALLCLLRTRLRLAGLAPIAAGLVLWALATPPDLVVSEDARTIAFPSNGRLLVERNGGSRYQTEDLQLLWGLSGDAVRLPHDGTVAGIRCDPSACRLRLRATTVLLARSRDHAPSCRDAALVLAPFPLFDSCRPVPSIDRFTVWREGAVAVWATPQGGVRLVSDRDWIGDRPWTVRPAAVARSSLPSAATE